MAQGRVTATEAAELLGALEPEPSGPHPGGAPPQPSGWPPGWPPAPGAPERADPPFGAGPFAGGFGPGPFGGRPGQGPLGGRPGPDMRWAGAWNDPRPGRSAPGRGAPGPGGPQRRTLVIVHRSGDGGQVEARVPLELGEAGRGLIPKQVREGLENHEINLDEVPSGQILAATPPGETIVSLQDVDGGQLTITVE